MPVRQAVVAAATKVLPDNRGLTWLGRPMPASDTSEHVWNFSPSLGLAHGNQAGNARPQRSCAFTLAGSELNSMCLLASRRHLLRVPDPAGPMTPLDDGVL